MTADVHRELRELLGSYTVGALSPEETTRVLAHLDGCPECRELLAELLPVAAALDAVDPAQLTASAPAPVPVEPVLAHIADEFGRRRRQRITAVGAAVAAVAAAVLLALVVLPGGDPATTTPAPQTRVLRATRPGVTGTVALLDRFWGTQLTLRAAGLPAQRPLVIWLQQRGGRRVAAGTLTGLGATPIRAQLAAAIRVRDTEAVGVSDDAGTVLLSAPIRG